MWRFVQRTKTIVSINYLNFYKGWGANGQFEGIVGSEEARTTFSKNVIEFCRKWGFDGIDLGKLK